jgi:EmrB/QacA subfamily drug resistance transporter
MARILAAPTAPSKWLTLIAVCLGLAMVMIDTFVVNVALPAIGRDLDAALGSVEWIVSGYVLVVGVFPLAMGRVGDILGRRKVYLVGLIVFVVASAGCGMAQSIEQLIALRVVQGFGAAIMMPGTLAILVQAFPPQQRGLAVGLWGGVSGLGLIAGPLLGGLLVNGDSWRWIFLVNVPLGVVALAMGIRYVAESRDAAAPRSIDFLGAALLAGGLGIVMLGITEANLRGWSDPLILAAFVAGAGLLGAFIAAELRLRYPLVDLKLFANAQFTMGCVAAFLFSGAVFGSQPFTSLFMQNYLGFSALQGGVAFLPATALVATLMPFSGIIGQKLGPQIRLLLIAGSALVALSFVYLLRLDPAMGYAEGLLPAFILRGLGIGLFMSTSSLAVMSALPMNKAGLASGTLTMFRQVGTAMGVAVFGALFAHHVDSELAAQPEDLRTAAERFVPAATGASEDASKSAITGGFILIAEAGLAVSVVAAGSAFFLRRRSAPAASPVGPPAPAAGPR